MHLFRRPVKQIVAFLLVLLLLLSVTTAYGAAPGTAGDPLISQTYASGAFLQSTESDAAALVKSSLNTYYNETAQSLKAAYDGYMVRLGGLPGYAFAPSFTPFSLPAGATAGLVTGSTAMLVSGSASLSVRAGTVINISTGEEIGSGVSMSVGQRYFCAEDTTAVITATSGAVCTLDGYYTTTGTPAVNTMSFLDVRSADWFYGAVAYVTGKSLFTGTSAATFSPLNSMTRSMFVTVLYRLAGKPPVSGVSQFPDVSDPSSYFYAAVVWASSSKVVTGYSDGRFHPDDAITREQMAVIISRYAAYAGYSTASGNAAAYNAFTDKTSVADYAVDAMKWATASGIVSGADGLLLPKGTASRAQVAQIILNFCRKIMGVQ